MKVNINKYYSDMDKLKLGTLENGLSYYIYDNAAEGDVIRISLVVKVGSLMEEDSQAGIAHFIEHMCIYNSNFVYTNEDNIEVKKNSLMSGYTNFEETVYFLNCQIEELKYRLVAFRDIITGRNLVMSSMNEIKEELRLEIITESKTSKFRLQQIILPELVGIKQLKDKFPLGSLKCVQDLSFESVQRFHNKWYKPENSAVFIVGSIEKCKAKALLEEIFSTIERSNSSYVKPSFKSNISSSKVLMNTVHNLKYDEMQLYYLKPSLRYNSINDLKSKITDYFGLTLIEKYIKEVLMINEIDFISLAFVSERLLSEMNFNVLELKVKEGLFKKAECVFNIIIKELASHGLSEKQFIKYKQNFIYELTEYYRQNKVVSNKEIAKECVSNYLFNEPLISVNHEYNLCCSIVQELQLKDFNILIEKILKNENLLLSFNSKEDLFESKDKFERILNFNQ
ncbi:M16 family metallopeptidase [Clostridium pasteurianum]|uniref:Putative Zn-dependent peptidase n=1 Tax=Clostridium pasteurianum BC1 TaxID=86416 RepID=R4K8S5_CLOPA|nr:insulinase family protein [Clostridium pasteurianum]AGK96020.1 putative Zn-dependent peptidase [Clostridium pasteurianum BC1]